MDSVRSDSESSDERCNEDELAIRIDSDKKEDSDNEENKLVGDSQQQVISLGEQMQIMCDLYGFRQDTYWDCYRADQKDALRNKLSLIVSHEFVTEQNLVMSEDILLLWLQLTNSQNMIHRQKKMVSGLTSTIWKQGKRINTLTILSPAGVNV